jgi:hypothetical protein
MAITSGGGLITSTLGTALELGCTCSQPTWPKLPEVTEHFESAAEHRGGLASQKKEDGGGRGDGV